ncbi:MAG: sulfotransferase [Acidobacteria bacterium]|nr:sulfotransferase [Acidobacteriota bacterium]
MPRDAAAGKWLGLRRHFLVIGAQRSGTTWLYRNLGRHPDIWLPPVKELHFFDRAPRYPSPSHHASPPGWKRLSLILSLMLAAAPNRRMVLQHVKFWLWCRAAEAGAWPAFWFSVGYPFATIDANWYRHLFALGGEKITGDLTPAYSLLTEEDVAVVRELLPEARIVMVLRNPIERAWSHFKLECRMTGIRVDDVWAASHFLGRPDVFMRGDYASVLPRWRRHFGRDGVHVAYYDNLLQDPEGFFRGILDFLGAHSDLDIGFGDLRRRVNQSAPVQIPDEIRTALAGQYLESLRELCRIEPGRPEVWLREAEACIAPASADGR